MANQWLHICDLFFQAGDWSTCSELSDCLNRQNLSKLSMSNMVFQQIGIHPSNINHACDVWYSCCRAAPNDLRLAIMLFGPPLVGSNHQNVGHLTTDKLMWKGMAATYVCNMLAIDHVVKQMMVWVLGIQGPGPQLPLTATGLPWSKKTRCNMWITRSRRTSEPASEPTLEWFTTRDSCSIT
jgi:hypothetical protein